MYQLLMIGGQKCLMRTDSHDPSFFTVRGCFWVNPRRDVTASFLFLTLNLHERRLVAVEVASGLPTVRRNGFSTEQIHCRADPQRRANHVANLERACNFDVADPMQRAADHAAALSAIGLSAEDAGFNLGAEIG
jgi:hypothetical protein